MLSTEQIIPIARRNHLTFVIAGVILILLGLSLQQWGLRLPGFFALISGLVVIILGLLKWREPRFSLTLSPQQLVWHHLHGDIVIDWHNVIDLVVIKIDKGIEQHELHYLGLKLKDFTPVTKVIPLRAAKSLYHEYRSLLHVAMVDARSRGLSALLFQEHEDRWRGSDGKKIDGIVGIFAARIEQLKKQLGSDLYLPLTSLDRDQAEFVQFFRQYRDQVRIESD